MSDETGEKRLSVEEWLKSPVPTGPPRRRPSLWRKELTGTTLRRTRRELYNRALRVRRFMS